MKIDQLQNIGIEQAKIVISLKNDEINKLKATLKTHEIKSNMRQTDLKFKIDQMEHKIKIGEIKQTKIEDASIKQQQAFGEQMAHLQIEIQELKNKNKRLEQTNKENQRGFYIAISEEKIKTEREQQKSTKLKEELQAILKYFDPKKIMDELQKESLEDLPTYLNLYNKLITSSESLQYANEQMSKLRFQIICQMEKFVQKTNSQENMVHKMKMQNEELKRNTDKKDEQIRMKSEQIHSKTLLLQNIKEETELHLEHLNEQIIMLKEQLAGYQNQEKVISESHAESYYLEQIEELQKKIMIRDEELQTLSKQYEDKLNNIQTENSHLKQQLEQIELSKDTDFRSYKTHLDRIEHEWEKEKEVMALLNQTLKEQQLLIEQLNNEIHSKNIEIEILTKKNQNREESTSKQSTLHAIGDKPHNQNQTFFNEKDEIRLRQQSLRKQSIRSKEQKNQINLKRILSGDSLKYAPKSKNLLEDLNQEVLSEAKSGKSEIDYFYCDKNQNWAEKYYVLLKKHNSFIKIVQSRLKKIVCQRL